MLTDTYANNVLNAIVGTTSSATISGSNVYMGLFTTTPTYAGSNATEPSASSYERVSVKGCFGSSEYIPAYYRWEVTNSSQIKFNLAEQAWGEITHFGLFTSATGGTPFYIGEILDENGDKGIVVDTDTLPVFKTGQLVLYIENTMIEEE